MKCVMVIDKNLPIGLIANTSAVLAMSIGKKIDGIIGHDVKDKDGNQYSGITQLPVAILKGESQVITSIYQKINTQPSEELFVVTFSDVAQKSKTYDDYQNKLSKINVKQLSFLGIALYGPGKIINKLTGSIGLLR